MSLRNILTNFKLKFKLDLGNYERFLNVTLSNCHSITSGKIYSAVIEKERKGDYLGSTVQMVPHVTDYIQEQLRNASQMKINGNDPDICLVELGGSIGDMEGLVFCEAIAQLTRNTLPDSDSCFVHLSYVPTINGEEIKTKPTQHSIRTVRSLGIFPDFLILRMQKNVLKAADIEKVARMCQMRTENIFISPNTDTVYDVPKILIDQKLHIQIADKLKLSLANIPDFAEYEEILSHFNNINSYPEIVVGIVGKYTGSQDTYLSLMRALEMASVIHHKKIKIKWINSEMNINDMNIEIDNCDRIIIPGGFGERGIEGMIHAINRCRVTKKKLLGICLGFQLMCIEYARNVLHLYSSNSTEFDKNTEHPIIIPVASETILGGTMRLGNMNINITRLSKMSEIYANNNVIQKRFRHRYGLNKIYLPQFVATNWGRRGSGGCGENDINKFDIVGETNDGMISNIIINDNQIGVCLNIIYSVRSLLIVN